ncbi:SafA/ExsA family spore coat assembly protein [Cerasibacillus terrae]|uniref:SafA/ExsA family spore coat assembly protein n=1 Tax=Cerasibacillus terrae TaxID=2498845 RepID=A0A5C8P4B1_9BACI|nr:SafA/ExsA family spore coat assembly protein [Cerasibacillus terrae]
MKIHIVQKGDTLWEIAKMYGVDFEELKSLNSQLSSPDMIMPGMKIKVPGVEKTVKKETPKEKQIKKETQTKKEIQIKPTPQPKETKKEEKKKILQPAMPTPPLPKMPEISVPKMPEITMDQQLPVIEQQMNQYTVFPEITIDQKVEHPKQEQKPKEKQKKEEKKPIQEPSSFEQMQPMPHPQPMYQPMFQPMPFFPVCCCMMHPCHKQTYQETHMNPLESHKMMQMPHYGYSEPPKVGGSNVPYFPHEMKNCSIPKEVQYGNAYPFEPSGYHQAWCPPIYRTIHPEPDVFAPEPPSYSYEGHTTISKEQEE